MTGRRDNTTSVDSTVVDPVPTWGTIIFIF